FGDANERELNRHREVVEVINDLEPEVQKLSDEQLRAKTIEFKQRVADGEMLDDIVPEAFAVVREAAVRAIGQRLYDVQLIGGIVLHQGKIAEMKTGEGKTLGATLPLYVNALSGRGAHLVTPNDYLSKFGLQQMGPVYVLLGLTTAVIQNRGGNEDMHSFRYNLEASSDDARFQNLEPISRREAYAADITYGTNNEFGFDYLRDNMVRSLPQMVQQRGHHFAIVDEVDNILIDEARTPLIISGVADQPSDYYAVFAKLVTNLVPSSLDSIDIEEPDGDYVEDLQRRGVYLTEQGVEKMERLLDRAGEMEGDNLFGPENSDMLPYLDNALRARVVYHKDKEYVVVNGQVIIVDEFTGRMMHGRRFSEGLHQAIEAKEGVEVRRENLTLATVTFQNYFRMYEKLAGMTGTAATEASEFEEIYELEVTVIPTNVPTIRDDRQDLVFMTEKAKWNAVVADIKERQDRGQPILVGTAAIETSERLAKQLTKAKIAHEILNAKQHEREAVIIAQAGRPGAVTIATNMAGRGVDILLGGNPDGLAREILRRRYGVDVTEATEEQWQEVHSEAKLDTAQHRSKVLAEGGLYVLGTERHEARRIDNQLRGRSGRQGDPGESRFYLSLEDDLMRRFGGDRVKNLMKMVDIPEEMPIEHGMISKSIQQAQIRVEAHNFDIRKRVLEYDDVVNQQRKTIYDQRRRILNAEPGELREQIHLMITAGLQPVCEDHLTEHAEDWDMDELHRAALTVYPVPETVTPARLREEVDPDAIETLLVAGALEVYGARIERYTEEWMLQAERIVMLNAVDELWQRHLTDLDVLREGIGLVGFGGRDPLVEYQRQSFEMWQALQDEIRSKLVQDIFRVAPPEHQQQRRRVPAFNLQRSLSDVQTGRGSMPQLGTAAAEAAAAKAGKGAKPETRRGKGRPVGVDEIPGLPLHISEYDGVGPNDECPCQRFPGKKFKKCCYPLIRDARRTVSQDQVKQRTSTRRRRR
ncbi:MAG: preprotein translocase subunit SecA, partial [Anaerolineae bacterium]|nr:preprotein translocase subunit SecA [Anaerolineae bacterium]